MLVAWLLGCNPVGEEGAYTGLGCVGGMQVKNGPFEGTYGALTHFFSWTEGTASTGTGQWYP